MHDTHRLAIAGALFVVVMGGLCFLWWYLGKEESKDEKVLIKLASGNNDDTSGYTSIGKVRIASNLAQLTTQGDAGAKGVIAWKINPTSKWKATFNITISPASTAATDDGIFFRAFATETTAHSDWGPSGGVSFYYMVANSSIKLETGTVTNVTGTKIIPCPNLSDGKAHQVDLSYKNKTLTCAIDGKQYDPLTDTTIDELGFWTTIGSWNSEGSSTHNVSNLVVSYV